MTTNATTLPFSFDHLPLRGKVLHVPQCTAHLPSLKNAPADTTKTVIDLLLAAMVLQQDFKDSAWVQLQIQNPESGALLFARCDNAGNIRAYANAQARALKLTEHAEAGSQCVVMMMPDTTDPHAQAYQSVIPMTHFTVADMLTDYFNQSVQLPTQFRTFVDATTGHATGLFVQETPQAEGVPRTTEALADDWHRISVLLDTLQTEEATTTEPITLVQRLFAEDEVRVFTAHTLAFQTENPRVRMAEALKQLGKDAATQALNEQGELTMHDDVSGQTETFTQADVATLFAEIEPYKKD